MFSWDSQCVVGLDWGGMCLFKGHMNCSGIDMYFIAAVIVKLVTTLPFQSWRITIIFMTRFRCKNTLKGVFCWKTNRVVQRRVQNGKMKNNAGAQDPNTYLRAKVRGQTYPFTMIRSGLLSTEPEFFITFTQNTLFLSL